MASKGGLEPCLLTELGSDMICHDKPNEQMWLAYEARGLQYYIPK